MGFELAPHEHQAWREDGFFLRLGAFGRAELAVLREAAERAAERAAAAAGSGVKGYSIDGNLYCEAAGATLQFEHRPGSTTLRVLEPFHHLDGRFEALIDDPRLVAPARGLVGCERVALFTDKLNLKRPREGSGFRWHQDSPYWSHATPHLDRLPNAMLALDDAHLGNGCLRLVRGSHRRGCLPGLDGQGVLGPLFTDPRGFDAGAQVPAEMPAGSLLFFSPHAVHGSQPNLSDEPRRALLLTYQPAGHRMFKIAREREAGHG